MNCPVCSSSSAPWRASSGYVVRRCTSRDCRHGFVDPTPSAEELEQFYSSSSDQLANSNSWTMARDYERDSMVVRRFFERARIRQLRRDGLLSDAGVSIVDVGASTGVFLRVLRDLGFQNVLGQEISDEQREFSCQELGVASVKSLREIPDDSTDLITAYAVLEHLPDSEESLREIWRILRKGGSLVVDVPNSSSFYEKVSRKHWMWLIPPAHLNYFTFKSLSRVLVKAGFSLEARRTRSTSSQLFIAAFHLGKVFGFEVPNTSLSSSWIRRNVVWFVESMVRILLFPITSLARVFRQDNQLIFVATK